MLSIGRCGPKQRGVGSSVSEPLSGLFNQFEFPLEGVILFFKGIGSLTQSRRKEIICANAKKSIGLSKVSQGRNVQNTALCRHGGAQRIPN